MSRHFTTGGKNAPVEYVRITAVMTNPALVLASNSPRRRELLALGGWTFSVRPADVDESQLPGESPGTYVLRLAESKANACALSAQPGEVIVAADTTVAIDGNLLGKPRDAADAAEKLRLLRGRRHQVHTGIGVKKGNILLTDLCTTNVPMRSYSEDEIAAYVATGDPLDKAGAYAIQHADFHPVESLSGCFASVMGLPLCHLLRLLRRVDVHPAADVPGGCQASLDYQCPISAAVLRGEAVG
jgi:septum formation protein